MFLGFVPPRTDLVPLKLTWWEETARLNNLGDVLRVFELSGNFILILTEVH